MPVNSFFLEEREMVKKSVCLLLCLGLTSALQAGYIMNQNFDSFPIGDLDPAVGNAATLDGLW
jgi:hypothetical protein